jgi:hypothetical protein
VILFFDFDPCLDFCYAVDFFSSKAIFLDELGTLVHSCAVRDTIGNEFILLDDRGFRALQKNNILLELFRCVTDNSLMHPPSYSSELNVSYSLISAFKFADQMVVYFTCQITMCTKRDNGCEGITVTDL